MLQNFAHTEPKTLHLQPPLNTNVDHLQKFSWEISETYYHLIKTIK